VVRSRLFVQLLTKKSTTFGNFDERRGKYYLLAGNPLRASLKRSRSIHEKHVRYANIDSGGRKAESRGESRGESCESGCERRPLSWSAD